MQAVATTVVMDADGRLTIPAETSAALGINGAMLLEVETADDVLILRPSVSIPEEDVWVYAPEHVARVKQALASPRDQDVQLSLEELERLMLGSAE